MKQSCKYHPGESAVWYCPADGIHFCEDCVAGEDTPEGPRARCFLCNKPLQSVRRGGEGEPFWHHLSHFIQYPLSRNPLLVMAALAILCVAIPADWIGLGLAAALGLPLGMAGKAVMDHTVSGHLRPPGLAAFARPDLLPTGAQLWLIFAGASVGLALGYQHFGMLGGGALAVLAWLILPALLIRTEMEGNLLVPLFAPMRLLGVMAALGVDYLLMAGFLAAGFLALSLTVSIVAELPSWVAHPAAALVVSWFFLSLCHLSGYMLRQRREALGYEAATDQSRSVRGRARRPEAERREAVLLREGRFRRVTDDYQQRLEKQPESLALNDQYQRLLQALGRRTTQLEHGGQYLNLLIKNQQEYRAVAMLRHYRTLDPAFRPATAQGTWEMAQLLEKNGEAKLAVNLLADQHKRTPTWPGLARAYLFVARILKNEFRLDGKAQQYLRFVETRYRDAKSQELAKTCRAELFGSGSQAQGTSE